MKLLELSTEDLRDTIRMRGDDLQKLVFIRNFLLTAAVQNVPTA